MADYVNEARRQALIELIRESGHSIESFAALMARSTPTLYRWLQGKRPIPYVVERWIASVGQDIVRMHPAVSDE